MDPEYEKTLIDKYLLGTLSQEEAESFEQKRNDPEFQAELAFRKDLMRAIKAEGREQLRSELQTLNQEANLAPKEKQAKYVYMWISMAAAAVLALIFVFRLVVNEPPDSKALFAQHFEPYPNVERVITRNQQIDQNLDTRAYANYELARYQEAVRLFDELISEQPGNLSHRFYRALAYLALSQGEIAIPELIKVAQSDTSRYAHAAEWFLALAYLQEAQLEEARSNLKEISQQAQHPYYEEALELLDQID